MRVTIDADWQGRCQVSTDYGLPGDWGDQATLIVRRADLAIAADGPRWAAIDFTQPGAVGIGESPEAAFENLRQILAEIQ